MQGVSMKWSCWFAAMQPDEDYSTRGFFFGNEPPDFADTLYTKFGDPRTIGITVTFNHPAY